MTYKSNRFTLRELRNIGKKTPIYMKYAALPIARLVLVGT